MIVAVDVAGEDFGGLIVGEDETFSHGTSISLVVRIDQSGRRVWSKKKPHYRSLLRHLIQTLNPT